MPAKKYGEQETRFKFCRLSGLRLGCVSDYRCQVFSVHWDNGSRCIIHVHL